MLEWLFDRSMGMPGPQGHWPPWMTLLFHTSNFFTAMGLLFIPMTIIVMLRRRRRGVRISDWMILLGMFPALATSRAIRFLEIYGPPYNLTTITDTVSAIVTIWAASKLPPICEHLSRLPSRREMERVLVETEEVRMDAEAERLSYRESIRQLYRRVDKIEVALDTETWAQDVRLAIVEMRAILAEYERGPTDGS